MINGCARAVADHPTLVSSKARCVHAVAHGSVFDQRRDKRFAGAIILSSSKCVQLDGGGFAFLCLAFRLIPTVRVRILGINRTFQTV